MVLRIFMVCFVISAFITFAGAGKSFAGLNLQNIILPFVTVAPLLLLALYKKTEPHFNIIRVNLLRSISLGLLGYMWLTVGNVFGEYSITMGAIFDIPQRTAEGEFSISYQIIALLFRAVIMTGVAVSFVALFYLLFGINKFINAIQPDLPAVEDEGDFKKIMTK